MSINIKPSWAKLLTVGQITQMIVGIVVIGWYFFKIYSKGEECFCARPDLLTVTCVLMYGSYLYLFLQFYFKRYSKKQKKE
jgi:elongation of very long chain fatty acids protein 6